MKKHMNIELNSIEKVKEFVSDIRNIEGDLDLISGKYVIDAKSIMGIFSLDLTSPLELHYESEKEEDLEILEKYEMK